MAGFVKSNSMAASGLMSWENPDHIRAALLDSVALYCRNTITRLYPVDPFLYIPDLVLRTGSFSKIATERCKAVSTMVESTLACHELAKKAYDMIKKGNKEWGLYFVGKVYDTGKLMGQSIEFKSPKGHFILTRQELLKFKFTPLQSNLDTNYIWRTAIDQHDDRGKRAILSARQQDQLQGLFLFQLRPPLEQLEAYRRIGYEILDEKVVDTLSTLYSNYLDPIDKNLLQTYTYENQKASAGHTDTLYSPLPHITPDKTAFIAKENQLMNAPSGGGASGTSYNDWPSLTKK